MQLPKTLHELLQIALNDLEKAEQAGDIIDMDTWYEPKLFKKCKVCLAGAVMKN